MVSTVNTKEVIVIGKIMILSFSDAEEHILDKLKAVFEDEKNIEYIEIMPKSVLRFHELEIHVKEQEVYRRGTRVSLSRQEFLALQLLSEHPGWVCTKEQIYDAVCTDLKLESIDNSVYCIVHSLRKKLEADPQHPQYIQTVRGIGYKFISKIENS
ncbi:winged helix-turn-helix domain-containing protein [Anaerostipes caccae]|uniref:winged helix-turn-helix domain-containing protein n=1 Tax=Anaerostipes caccae TaxID=105841 RepID=UPI00267358F2|nr:response regulator transcription factor [Anaerostipes caccae]